MDIPFDRLGIPTDMRDKLVPEAALDVRMGIAQGKVDLAPDLLLNALYVLVGDPNPQVSGAATQTLAGLTSAQVMEGLGFRTHPKVLELLVEGRLGDQAFLESAYMLSGANDRTCRLIAAVAEGPLVEVVCRNQQRLLMTPEVFLDLKANEHVETRDLERVEAFLRMQGCLPSEDGEEEEAQATNWAEVKVTDLTERFAEAEVAAALLGLPSPFTNPDVADKLGTLMLEHEAGDALKEKFVFSFIDDGDEFGGALTTEDKLNRDEVISMEQTIREMKVGKRIKLAYLGNAEARKILLRDKSKQVAVAVVKSGRMSDSEAAAAAANKNLHMDVLREIATNKEFLRKYKVKVALANNPKTPVSVAVTLVKQLHRADLASLARNKGVPSVVSKSALKLVKALRAN
jgi:hypothetical protein